MRAGRRRRRGVGAMIDSRGSRTITVGVNSAGHPSGRSWSIRKTSYGDCWTVRGTSTTTTATTTEGITTTARTKYVLRERRQRFQVPLRGRVGPPPALSVAGGEDGMAPAMTQVGTTTTMRAWVTVDAISGRRRRRRRRRRASTGVGRRRRRRRRPGLWASVTRTTSAEAEAASGGDYGSEDLRRGGPDDILLLPVGVREPELRRRFPTQHPCEISHSVKR